MEEASGTTCCRIKVVKTNGRVDFVKSDKDTFLNGLESS